MLPQLAGERIAVDKPNGRYNKNGVCFHKAGPRNKFFIVYEYQPSDRGPAALANRVGTSSQFDTSLTPCCHQVEPGFTQRLTPVSPQA